MRKKYSRKSVVLLEPEDNVIHLDENVSGDFVEPIVGDIVGDIIGDIIGDVAEPIVEDIVEDVVEPITDPVVEPVKTPSKRSRAVKAKEPVIEPVIEPVKEYIHILKVPDIIPAVIEIPADKERDFNNKLRELMNLRDKEDSPQMIKKEPIQENSEVNIIVDRPNVITPRNSRVGGRRQNEPISRKSKISESRSL